MDFGSDASVIFDGHMGLNVSRSVTALSSDSDGNSSEFSIGTAFDLFLFSYSFESSLTPLL